MVRRTLLVGIVAVAAAMVATATQLTGSAQASGSAPTAPSLASLRPVSLSHVNDPKVTNVFPGDPEFSLTTIATVGVDGFYQQYVREAEHTGTHWGAPCHFHDDEKCADQLTPADLYLHAVRIDIRAKVRDNADYQLTIADIQQWERAHGRIPNNAAVILQTGWDTRWGTPAYPNFDADGTMHQPGFSLAAATWLIQTGRLGERGALGADTFGPDPGTDETYSVSSLVFHRSRIDLENLTNLDALPAQGAWILVGGPINRHGSGSTATIWGLVPPAK